MKINRRKHPRILGDIGLNLLFGVDGIYKSPMVDVSMHGIQLHKPDTYTPRIAENCRVEVKDESVDVSFSVNGEVAWVSDDLLGIKFTEISRDAKRMLNGLVSDLSENSLHGHNSVAAG